MSDEVTRQAEEARAGREDYDWMVVDRDTWQAVATKATADRDAALADLKQAEENNRGLMMEVQNMRAGLEVATEERDTANQAAEISYVKLQQALLECDTTRADVLRLTEDRDNWKQRAELAEHEKQKTADAERRAWLNYDCAERLKVERDAARADLKQAEEKCQKLHAENEGLRADAMAYPPQRLDLQQYANLKADYDRQVIMIETLQEALKRTEAMLAKAQGQHIDDRLKGFLAVISQLADQAQDLLP